MRAGAVSRRRTGRRPLRACLSLFRIQVAEEIQYRLSALSGAAIGCFWGIIEITVLTVFYQYAKGASGYEGISLAQAASYIWLGQIFFSFYGYHTEPSIQAKIESGDVALELCRPLGLYGHWYAKNAAVRLSPLLWRGGATLLVALLLPGSWGISPPASPLHFVLFLLSMGASFFLCSAYGMIMSCVRLNVTWGNGPVYLLSMLGSVLGGAALPLPLWPDFLQPVLALQPFAGTIDTPARLYTGALATSAALPFLLLQLVWTAVFVVLGKVIMTRHLSKLIIQGG